MTPYIIINEELVPQDDATVSVFDLGLLRGYGIFDYLRTVTNHPIWLSEHLDRFLYSAGEVNLPLSLSKERLKELVMQLMKKNDLPDSGVRILLTGGESDDGFSCKKSTLVIIQEPFLYNRDHFEKGIRLVTYEHQRQLPHIKTTDYIQAIRLRNFIKESNADELLYTAGNAVLEAPRSNIFMVNDQDEIITPSQNILKGINRSKILQMPAFRSKEMIISPEMLMSAKEVFLASTTKTILPVLNINGKEVGNGRPGEVTRKVWKNLLELQVTT